MTPLQSWLLVIAVVAVVTLAVIVVWTIIDLALYAIELERVRQRARAAKLFLNAAYGKRHQAHQIDHEWYGAWQGEWPKGRDLTAERTKAEHDAHNGTGKGTEK